MTERELILLGFKSEEIREHDEDDSYYPLVRFYKFGELQGLINQLTLAIVK